MSHKVYIDSFMVILENFIKKGVEGGPFEIIKLETYRDLTTRESVFRILFTDSQNEKKLEHRMSEEMTAMYERSVGIHGVIKYVGSFFVSVINRHYKEDKTHGE